MPEYYVGLMSGTSMDGIDAVLVDLGTMPPSCAGRKHRPMPGDLRKLLINIATSQAIRPQQFASADVQFGRLAAETVVQLLSDTKLRAPAVNAIGSHGQTIYHCPTSDTPTSIQVGDPNIIAEITGITTVADFRRRDIAARGQGAPLVPAFHNAAFWSPVEDRCVVNIGGMANITVLPRNEAEPVTGFDTGPGNVLMDLWSETHTGNPLDKDGIWAAAGKIDNQLLTHFLQDSYFSLSPPKSTGRECFNADWLNNHLESEAAREKQHLIPQDVQATLCELTALAISDAICRWAPNTQRLLVCGGGVHNKTLLQRLESHISYPIQSTTEFGVEPDWVEAVAFAWLAKQTLGGHAGNIPTVTGAVRPVVLGGIYPGGYA